jgi:hypothetical protein
MSVIPANQVINVIPTVMTEGGSSTSCRAVVLTENLDAGVMLSFSNTTAVEAQFVSGPEVDIAKAYFAGWEHSMIKPVVISFFGITRDNPGWSIIGGAMPFDYSYGITFTLKNNKILIIPGQSTDCYLFDGVNWIATGDLPYEFLNPYNFKPNTGITLQNGQALLIGNVYDGGSELSTNEAQCLLYDPSVGTWSPTGSMVDGRASCFPVLLRDGQVLVYGGYNSSLGWINDRYEIYNPTFATWTRTILSNYLSGSIYYALSLAPPILMSDGRVFMFHTSNNGSMGSCSIFDPTTFVFINITKNDGVVLGTSTGVFEGAYNAPILGPNGSIYLLGCNANGYESTSYNPITNTWRDLPDAPNNLQLSGRLSVVGSKRISMVAGAYTNNESFPYGGNILFNTSAWEWEPGFGLPGTGINSYCGLIGQGYINGDLVAFSFNQAYKFSAPW